MDTKKIFGIILMALLLLPCRTFAQYADHRNRQVDSLEHILQTNPPQGVDLAKIYQRLMYGYQHVDIDKSMEYACRMVPILEGTEYPRALADAYEALGVGYYRKKQYDSTFFYYNKALEAAQLMKNYKNYTERAIDDKFSRIYGQTGNFYNTQGLYSEAIEYYNKALAIFEKHDWKESQAIAYYNIGEMYKAMDNYEQAKINFIKLDALAHELNDSLFIAYSKQSLSMIALQGGYYDKALEDAETAYRYYFSHPEEGEFKLSSLNLLSEIYLKGYSNRDKAEEYVLEALRTSDTFDFPFERAVSLRLLSQIHLQRGQWRQAEQTALEGLAADDSEPANTMALYQILSKACAHLGNPAKSAEYFDKHNALQASYSNKHYQSAIREMEVKYETEKKETRITTLEEERRLIMWLGIVGGAMLLLIVALLLFLWRWTVQKRRLAEQQVKQLEQEKQLIATQALLDGELQERTRLARDLHDSLGSILAAAKYSLLDIKRVSVLGNTGEERYNKAVDLLDDSMREMRRVAHHLMPESLSQCGLKQSVADFCNSLSCVRFAYYGSEARFDPKMEAMVYRILHELVTNALKHAGASHILVQIVRDQSSITLTVQDDGCGFDLSAESKGMGLTNIRTRVAAFNGHLLIDSKAGIGTEVNVELRVEI